MNHFNCFVLAILCFANYRCCECENPKLTVELINSGFHRFVFRTFQWLTFDFNIQKSIYTILHRCRELKYVVVFPDYQGKHSTFLIKQLIPSSVYVSIDQLNDLKRLDKVNTPFNVGTIDFSLVFFFIFISTFQQFCLAFFAVALKYRRSIWWNIVYTHNKNNCFY